MSTRNLTEIPTTLIQAQIQNNIAATLAALHLDRGDSAVNLDVPPTASYFTYAGSKAYRAPAVFTVPQGIDFKLVRGQNFVDATLSMIVSIVCEDRNQNNLSLKAWRYMDALHELLQGIELQDAGSKVKIVISVTNARFSSDQSEKTDMDIVFRKEVALDCGIEVYQEL